MYKILLEYKRYSILFGDWGKIFQKIFIFWIGSYLINLFRIVVGGVKFLSRQYYVKVELLEVYF